MTWKKDITDQFNILQREFRSGKDFIKPKIETLIKYFEHSNERTPLSFSSKIITDNTNLSSIRLKLFFTQGIEEHYIIDFYENELCIYKTNAA